MEGKESVGEIILKVQEDMCINFCKYFETSDEEANCDWVRQGNECPLDRLG